MVWPPAITSTIVTGLCFVHGGPAGWPDVAPNIPGKIPPVHLALRSSACSAAAMRCSPSGLIR
jgi:hypothetical protein